MWYKRLEIISCKRHVLIWASLLATLLFAAQAAVSMPHAPIARAAGSGPIIHWNASMIYAGENNGNPWGPVGENASVEGANFPANQQFRLVLVQGNSNNDATLCHSPVATVASATSNSAGQFYQNYSWPAAAGQVNKAYSICAIKAADGSVASSKDDGPFTVLASSPPVIAISPASVAAGSTVTVTGHNWVPPQPVNINIAGCADCEPGNTEVTSVTAHSTGLNDGSFSIVVTIPASTKAANYVVNAQTQSGMDANYTSGVKHLTITAAAPAASPTTAPTSTPTAAATTTPVSTVTPTAVPGANNTGSNNGSDSGNSGPMLALLVALSLLLLAIAAVVVFMLVQRSAAKRRASAAPLNNYGQAISPGGPISNGGYSMQQGGPTSNAGYPMQQGSYGQYGQATGLAPGYNQAQPSNYPSNNYGQPVQPYGSSPSYGQPYPPSQSTQQYGSSQGQPQELPPQTMQQGWPGLAHNQYMDPNGHNDATVANIALCAHCGSPLAPNEQRCNRCGMPIGAGNASISPWSR